MKQFFLFFIFGISVSNLFAQQKKGDNYIGINGMYNTTISQDGVEGNSVAVKSHLLNMGMTLSGSMNNHFLIGIGLDYVSQNDDRNSSFIFHNQNNDYIKYETMNLKSHVFLPNLFVGYYSHIVDRLYFNSNLKLSYGQVKTNTDGQQVSFKYTPPATTIGIPSGTVDVPVVYTNKAEDKTDFASTAIIPELNYYFSNNFGLTLGLGGIQYSLTKWKTENSSFTVNFNPSNWQIGAKIRIK